MSREDINDVYERTFRDLYGFEPEDLDGMNLDQVDEESLEHIFSTGYVSQEEDVLYLVRDQVIDAGILYKEMEEMKDQGYMARIKSFLNYDSSFADFPSETFIPEEELEVRVVEDTHDVEVEPVMEGTFPGYIRS